MRYVWKLKRGGHFYKGKQLLFVTFCFCFPVWQIFLGVGSLHGKNLLLLGAHSFLQEKPPIKMEIISSRQDYLTLLSTDGYGVTLPLPFRLGLTPHAWVPIQLKNHFTHQMCYITKIALGMWNQEDSDQHAHLQRLIKAFHFMSVSSLNLYGIYGAKVIHTVCSKDSAQTGWKGSLS